MNPSRLWTLSGALVAIVVGGLVTGLFEVGASARQYTDNVMSQHNAYQDRMLSEMCGMRQTMLAMQEDIAIIKYFNVPPEGK